MYRTTPTASVLSQTRTKIKKAGLDSVMHPSPDVGRRSQARSPTTDVESSPEVNRDPWGRIGGPRARSTGPDIDRDSRAGTAAAATPSPARDSMRRRIPEPLQRRNKMARFVLVNFHLLLCCYLASHIVARQQYEISVTASPVSSSQPVSLSRQLSQAIHDFWHEVRSACVL